MKAIVLSARSPIRRPSLRRGFPPSRNYGAAGLLIPLLLACFGLAPMVQAVGPDTDGAIPGSNNGEGTGVLVSRTSGVWNTGTGFEALSQLTGGNQNTATGLRALFSDTNGGFNTATGVYSLFSNTSGFFNSATGAYSLANNTAGTHNTANGYAALYRNDGDDNTATGFAALYHNTTGTVNTAVGSAALLNNTIGSFNTAVGLDALAGNTGGQENTAIGFGALGNNSPGNFNTAVGSIALLSSTGIQNTAVGSHALDSASTGNNNTALGAGALGVNTTGSSNTALGFNAGLGVSTANNVICVGTSGANVDNGCFIGNIYSNVQPIVGTDPDSVTIASNGRLGRGNVSSRRYKHDIKPMKNASEVLYALKPVSFRYNKEYDATQTLAFGLIAEEVAEVYPDLVGRNAEGQPESVRYEQINAMVLNELIKEHRKVQELEATVAEQQKTFESALAEQHKRIEALTSGLQKVSALVEFGKPALQTVADK